ncbi:hypothetical protein ACFX13_046200 [Malus domestica]
MNTRLHVYTFFRLTQTTLGERGYKHIISDAKRPAGPIPSSMLGLEAMNGKLDDFGFEDYLNDPRESETFRPVDTHHAMEVRLGLSKGPVAPSFM